MKNHLLLICCFCGIQSYGQNVGIGTSTPGSGLELKGPGLASQQRITDPTSGNSLVLQGGAGQNLKITGYNYGSGTAQTLHLSVDGANTIMNPNGGAVGIGLLVPSGGYLLDVAGPVKTVGSSTHFVAQATGGTNSWARLYMRSTAQSWFMGTSQNFNGNQLYLVDETSGETRLSIQPAGGTINLTGSTTQNVPAFGQPKAMVFLNSNGTIGRCYNGVTGATTGGCGITALRVNAGNYQITFPFDITNRFFAVSAEQACCNSPVTITYKVFPTTTLNIGTLTKDNGVINFYAADYPVMVIVY